MKYFFYNYNFVSLKILVFIEKELNLISKNKFFKINKINLIINYIFN